MTLEAAFKKYVESVRAVTASADRADATPAATKHQSRDAFILKSLVEDLEFKPEFQSLVSETALGFSKEPDKDTQNV